jgi:hypothetical protein
LGQFSKNYRTFKPKLSISSQIYGVGIQDPRSGIRKKPIPDPGSRGQKGTVSHAFSVPLPEEKNLGQFSKNYRTFKPKLSISSKKYGVGIQDPRSGIRKKPIPDPGSRGQKGTVSHELSLPPPGIEPGSPASQAGTLPKELSRQLIL